MVLNKIQDILGLASSGEVREKFDEEFANIILDERRIVFWRFGVPMGAMFGAFVLIVLMIVTSIMRYLYG